jgi:hypothetical protein
VHEPGAEGGTGPLSFDPEKYRTYLGETGWSEKVQDEWLETLWNMMGTFVDLAWGTDSGSDRFKNGDAVVARRLTA